jgi:ADP-heptose:LPS heptosyltransferase
MMSAAIRLPRPLLVQGMLGLGDNIHQRAVVRRLMAQRPVWLETPWPSVYHDLVGDRLRLVARPSKLRTQEKNRLRQLEDFTGTPSHGLSTHRIWYSHDQIRSSGGFLAAMCRNSGFPAGNFSLPVPEAWRDKARAVLPREAQGKPLMIYRPLVDRTEWNGCMQRNPDVAAYADLADGVADQFFVISIADLELGKEWAVSRPVGADVEFHRGELDFESIAGLMSMAGLVFCSPGFALVLAQAVGAPLATVFGGHESARLYDHGASNNLFIQPMNPCECFSKTHRCDKRIDIEGAAARLRNFIEDIHGRHPQQTLHQYQAAAV